MFLGKNPVGKTIFLKRLPQKLFIAEIFETGSRVISGTFLRFFSGCVMVSVPVITPVITSLSVSFCVPRVEVGDVGARVSNYEANDRPLIRKSLLKEMQAGSQSLNHPGAPSGKQ